MGSTTNYGEAVFPFESFLQLINVWTPHHSRVVSEWIDLGSQAQLYDAQLGGL